jgi:hypothetical protein
MRASILLLAALTGVTGMVVPANAQTNSSSHPFSFYIPTATPTATSTLFASGSSISPGRVAVDKAGNVFYIAHVSGASSTLYEIPASSPVVTVTAPTPLVSGLGQTNANSAFVDVAGTLWVSNGNGSGGALIEIPASAGVPGIVAITGNGSYNSTTGLPLSSITAACASASTVPCVWTASRIGSSLTSLQIGDVYSDGAGNVYLVDVSDSVSTGSYNRVIQFNTSSAGAINVLADKLTSNPYAQVTVAGDGNPYYCDSLTGNTSGGLVSSISGGALTTVANLKSASLTILSALVEVSEHTSSTTTIPSATGVTADPWGNLIISGPAQLSEVPLEAGALAWADQFNLLLAYATVGSTCASSIPNYPMCTNNVTYGGTFDVHGSYYYASATNIMQTQVGGYNFGHVSVGQEVTTAAPYLDITWSLPSELQTSLVATASPSTLPAADAAYLQSFPFSGNKNYFGGTPYGVANTGSGTYSQMYFQPIHPGLLMGAISPQGYSNALGDSVTGPSKVPASDLYMNGAYLANLQGVGVGPGPMFLPGTASQAVTMSQLYKSYSKTSKAVGFTPTGVAVDSFGDIFVTDTTNTSLDLDCLATTAATAQNYRAGAAGNGYANSYCLTDGVADTNKGNFAGSTFVVSATGVTAGATFPTSFITPLDVVMDGANNAYVLDAAGGTATVTRMPYATMIPSVVVPNGATVGGIAFNYPQGIAIDGYGNLYIADTGNNRIVQARLYNATYSQNIVYIPSSTTFGGIALYGPIGMGLDAAGDLFIADTGNKRIVEYSVTGVTSVVSTAGVTLVNPTNVKVLPSGALIVADSTLGLVIVNGGNASLLSTGAITLSSTEGLSLDQAGNVYVADPVGGQVVELNFNEPANASIFPSTLIGKTSTETSYIYNDGNASLTINTAPVATDTTFPASNEFSVDATNACTASLPISINSYCTMVMDFTPASVAIADVYSMVTGTATFTDSLLPYTLIANPASSAEAIASFGTGASTQTVTLSGNPTVSMTAQKITFTPITAVTWSTSIPTITLSATSNGGSGNPVTFSIVSGSGRLSGTNNSILTLTEIGTTVIAANQAGALTGGVYYSAAPEVTQAAVVNPIGTVATPTFSVAAGVYTAVQSVTIKETTAGAIVYYTINGNTPTISSPVYTAGTVITVGVTTTIKAIAVEEGYATSAIASATYTLYPDFVLTPYQTTFNIPAGQSGGSLISVAPLFGFDSSVTLSCSGLPAGASCSFVATSNTGTPTGTGNVISALSLANGATGYATWTLQTGSASASAAHPGGKWPFAPGGPYAPAATLAFAGLLFGVRKHKRLLLVLLLTLSAAGAGLISGCTSSTSALSKSTFTLTATSASGSVVHSQTITLIVNNF